MPQQQTKTETETTDHVTIKIPQELVNEMDKLIGKHGFRSRGEIAKEAIRELLAKYNTNPFEMLNHDPNGVKIIDRKLKRVADIQIKPNGIHCLICNASNCEHIRYALNQPDIQHLIHKKRKEEGWQLLDPDETTP